MQFTFGYKFDTTGIQQAATSLEQAELVSKELARAIGMVEDEFSGMKAGTRAASQAVTALSKVYDELNKGLKELSSNESTAQLATQVEKAMAKVKGTIESTQSYVNKVQKAGLDTTKAVNQQSLNATIRANTQKIKEEKQTAQQLQQIWRDNLKQYQNIEAQKNATSSLKDFSVGKTGARFNETLFNTAMAVTGIDNLTGAFANLGHQILEIDYNLQNTQRIMGDFSESTRDYLLENAAETARLTNTQITDVQEIQGAWSRINSSYAENVELLTKITTLTSKFMNVGEIEDAETAVNLLNASLLQFNVNMNDSQEVIAKSEEFLNKWAYMADITAMGTADEYGEAISKYGAVVQSLNGDMDDAIALSSILADRLAKNGAEAGTALKTFTTYMHRTKTTTLFNDIAADLGDTSYQLVDANGKLKDFDENLRLLAKAYDTYKTAGNDVMANKILEAVGATRQRDTAMAVLTGVNEGDFDKYLREMQDSDVNNYLNEQNAALMETLSASINDMKVSFQELFMTLGNAGAIGFITQFVDICSDLLQFISKLPEPLLQTVEAIAAFKVAQTASSYLGQLTGFTEKYNNLMVQGSLAEQDTANAISASANAYMERMKFMGQNNQLTAEQIEILFNQKSALSDLNTAYNNGEISAAQYSEAVTNLIGQEQLEANAKHESAQAALDKANAQSKTIPLTKQEEAQLKKNTAAEKQNAQAKKDGVNTEKQKQTVEKQGKTITDRMIASTNSRVLAEKLKRNQIIATNVQEKIMNTTLLKMIANTKVGAAVNTLLGTTFKGVGTAAAIGAVGVSKFMAALGPIMMVWSIGSMVWDLGITAQGLIMQLFMITGMHVKDFLNGHMILNHN